MDIAIIRLKGRSMFFDLLMITGVFLVVFLPIIFVGSYFTAFRKPPIDQIDLAVFFNICLFLFAYCGIAVVSCFRAVFFDQPMDWRNIIRVLYAIKLFQGSIVTILLMKRKKQLPV